MGAKIFAKKQKEIKTRAEKLAGDYGLAKPKVKTVSYDEENDVGKAKIHTLDKQVFEFTYDFNVKGKGYEGSLVQI